MKYEWTLKQDKCDKEEKESEVSKMPTIREKLQACIDDARELNESGLRYITDKQIDEAISLEIWYAEQNGEITHDEGNALYAEYTA